MTTVAAKIVRFPIRSLPAMTPERRNEAALEQLDLIIGHLENDVERAMCAENCDLCRRWKAIREACSDIFTHPKSAKLRIAA